MNPRFAPIHFLLLIFSSLLLFFGAICYRSFTLIGIPSLHFMEYVTTNTFTVEMIKNTVLPRKSNTGTRISYNFAAVGEPVILDVTSCNCFEASSTIVSTIVLAGKTS